MKNKRNHWKIKENVIEESKKYTSRSDFNKKSRRAYDSARKNKWLDEMHWLNSKNKKHKYGYWKNKENIMNEAKKYSTNDEFKRGNLTAFLAAYRYGYMEEITWLKKRKQHRKNYWDYKHIEEEALKYKTKTDFAKGNNTAYRHALKLGIVDDFFFNDYVEF